MSAIGRRRFLSTLAFLPVGASACRAGCAQKIWPIWSEGARLPSGGAAVAFYHGSGIGLSFLEACESRFRGDPDFRAECPPTWAGRVLYDNEDDARRAFG